VELNRNEKAATYNHKDLAEIPSMLPDDRTFRLRQVNARDCNPPLTVKMEEKSSELWLKSVKNTAVRKVKKATPRQAASTTDA